MTDKIVVLVTCETGKQARKIARTLVEKRLAACGNWVGVPVHSTYRWRGIVNTANEHLLILKSSMDRFEALEETVKEFHTYLVPEIIAVPITAGSAEYLLWMAESIGRRRPPQRRRGEKWGL
ncbi:MAG TPA: divalent-cation tolerance protein CutA [Candidatus Limnocylindrales bacterium]|nr:divalent-cation tolerance protein CutA [Candidatus Limnocylindrales bacterium]